MDSLRYWVLEMHVDGFRFDLASALARGAARRRPARQLLRHHPAGPGPPARQADRGAVGRRRGRLPGRQLPAQLVGVERQVPRHRARLLARRAGDARRVREPPDRVERPVRAGRSPAVGQHQLRHRPRRLHAPRPRLVQRQAQRGQRRGQPGRREPQPIVELRRTRDRPTTRPSTPAAPASSATSSRRCSCARACRCCSAATSSAAPRAATTTPTARTTRSPGSTGSTSTRDLARVHPARDRAPPAPPRPAPARAGSRGGRSTAPASATSAGSSPTARR